jgi:hypothetical protein
VYLTKCVSNKASNLTQNRANLLHRIRKAPSRLPNTLRRSNSFLATHGPQHTSTVKNGRYFLLTMTLILIG